jgi:hypothetical protein
MDQRFEETSDNHYLIRRELDAQFLKNVDGNMEIGDKMLWMQD